MKNTSKKTLLLLLIASLSQALATPSVCLAQEKRLTSTLVEGIIISGYLDGGGFLNFAGPGLKFRNKSTSLIMGMLPSLRFKKDESSTRHALVTPTLGFGATFIYRKLAIQLPVFYNAKTSTANGKWKPGIGIGFKL